MDEEYEKGASVCSHQNQKEKKTRVYYYKCELITNFLTKWLDGIMIRHVVWQL